MVGWLILIGLILLIGWTVWSESRNRRKAQEVLGDDYPDALKKTSTFGSSFFWLAMGAVTAGIILIVYRIIFASLSYYQLKAIGLVCFLPAVVLWCIGFRHDRPKVENLYKQKKPK